MAYRVFSVAQFGSTKSGLLTVGYTLYASDNTVSVARTTVGISDLGGGGYGAYVDAEDDGFTGRVQWDTGEFAPRYFSDTLNPQWAGTREYNGVSFGTGSAGLLTVGYRIYDDTGQPVGARVTAGVQDWGHGWYGAFVTLPGDFFGSIRWDDGAGHGAVALADLDAASFAISQFGPSRALLATVGYAIYRDDGTLYQARRTALVVNCGYGAYGVALYLTDPAFVGRVQFDTGEATPLYYNFNLNPDSAVSEFFLGAYLVRAGLTTVGYQLIDRNGVACEPRVTTNITEWGGGWYGAPVVIPAAFQGSLVWDDGRPAPIYAASNVNLTVAGALSQGTGTSGATASNYGAAPLTYEKAGGGLVLEPGVTELRVDQSPDLLNVDLDEETILKRFGRAAFNAVVPAAVTSQRVRSVGAFYNNLDQRLALMQAGTKVYCDRARLSDFTDPLDEIITGLTGGVYADLIQYRNTLYFGNSVDGLRAWPGNDAVPVAYTPAITDTPATLPLLTIETKPVNDFETGTWTTRNAANSAGGTMTATKVTTLFKEGAGSLQLTLPNTAMNEFVYNDLAAPLDLSKADALGIWVYQSAGHGAAFQIALHDGTGNAFNWNLFPAYTVTDNQKWQHFRIPLAGVQAADRDGVQGIAIRFLGWGQTDAGVAANTLSYLYFDGCYALGPFPADTYQYYWTDTYNFTVTSKRESVPAAVSEIVVSEDVPVFDIKVTFPSGVGNSRKLYRHRSNGTIGTAKLITTVILTGGTQDYADLTSDATLILENRDDLVFGRMAPPKANTWCKFGNRLVAGGCTIGATYYPYRICISEFDNPEAFGSTLNPTFLINGPGYIDLPDKDIIRRMVEHDDSLIIFTDRSIWTLTGSGFDNGPTGYNLQQRADVGLVARNAVAKTGRHIFFYSSDGIRVLQPNRSNVGTFPCWRISEPVISRAQSVPKAYRPDAAMGIDERGRIHFSFTPRGGTVNDRALVFDPRREGAMSEAQDPFRPGWTYYSHWGFSCFATMRGGDDDQGDLFAGDVAAGRVWRLHQDANGNAVETDNGAAIGWHYRTRAEALPPGEVFEVTALGVSADAGRNEELTVAAVLDLGELEASGQLALGTARSGLRVVQARTKAGTRGRYLQIQVSGSHSTRKRVHSLGALSQRR